MIIPTYDQTVLPCLVLPMGNTREATKRYLGKRSIKQRTRMTLTTAPHGDAQQAALFEFWDVQCEGGTLPFEVSMPIFGTVYPRLLVYIVGNLTSSKTTDGLWVTTFKLKVYENQFAFPSTPTNFSASDDVVNRVNMTWDASVGYPQPTYAIYKDGVQVGTSNTTFFQHLVTGLDVANYYVTAVNQEGSSQSNTDSGTSVEFSELPNAPQQFLASDDQLDQITFTWFNSTEGEPVPVYDIYRVEVGVDTLIASNVISPHTEPIIGTTTNDYYVLSYNSVGEAASNIDSGTSIATPSGSQEYAASGLFTVPANVTSIDVCMIGGGGSGGCGFDDDYFGSTNGGGGYAGQIINTTLTVVPGTAMSVVCGAGGASVTAYNDGLAGSQSTFGGLIAAGGNGGNGGETNVNIKEFFGNGESRITCYGTFNNGLAQFTWNNYAGCGGEAGFADGGSCNGNTAADPGSKGSGGGGTLGINYTDSGAGGTGYVKISWGA